MMIRWLGVAILVVAMGCDGEADGVDGGAADGGRLDAGGADGGALDAGPADGGAIEAAERAACENVLAIDANGCGSGSLEGCRTVLVRDRGLYAGDDRCAAEWAPYLSCLTALDACDDGFQCPTEFGALRDCAADAACASLFTVDPAAGCANEGTIESCEALVVQARTAYLGDAECMMPWDEYVACHHRLEECAPDDGIECSDELDALTECASAASDS